MVLRRGRAALIGVAVTAALVACTDAPPPAPAAPESGALPGVELPQVTPQPKEMRRLGDDIAVRGRVEVVVDPLVDEPTRDLARQVLSQAGAEEVVVRQPGEEGGDVSLSVRVGDRTSPTVVKGLQELGVDAPAPLPPEGYVLAGRGGDALFVGASDPAGAYYGVQTLRQLTSPGRIAGVAVVDEPSMPLRGTIEGFYGPPWTHQERMEQLAFYGDVKLNTYIYAPKDDPYHRERWREPYPPDQLAEVRELIGQAAAHHVKFTFALSPGTSICYSDPADSQALLDKLSAVHAAGVRDFSIPLDDISYTRWNCAQDRAVYGEPSQAAAGRAQTELLNRVQREFVDRNPDVAPLQFVPTEYSDLDDSPYKAALRAGLDPRVQVMWTGDGVVPDGISVDDARRAGETWGRDLFLWDNYPVNDFDGSAGRLLLGPYAHREPGLSQELTGLVVNPMNQAAASQVVEFGAADFAWNDAAFDPARAWRAAAEHLAGDRSTAPDPGLVADPATADALGVFFDLLHAAPLPSGETWLPPAPELSRRIDGFHRAWQAGDRRAALDGLDAYARAVAEAPERIRAGAPPNFTSDAQPWLTAADLWGDALLASLDGLRARTDGDEALAGRRFDAAARLAAEAGAVRSSPEEVRPDAPVLVADGVLDAFVRQAPTLR
ncbi:beta-N-acetylhexosaminidase family protein [Saccharopolyspora cebuensis]|uniref:Beta-N-acetylglucosaminidase domain-containing protein n=1 Tax=Saccharopolyspora cebuensis TaxID=418759 RepID=A0ABV4CIC1_9PSEU